MLTNMLYEAERTRTTREQREFNTRNGEIALAIRRPFRLLRTSLISARQRPRGYGRPSARLGTFPCEPAAAETRSS
jgi:hypothetical protein